VKLVHWLSYRFWSFFLFFCSLFFGSPSSVTIVSVGMYLGRWQSDKELSEIWSRVIITLIVFIYCRATKVCLRRYFSEIAFCISTSEIILQIQWKIWLVTLGLQFFLLTLTLIHWETLKLEFHWWCRLWNWALERQLDGVSIIIMVWRYFFMIKVNSLMSTENCNYCCCLYVLLYLTDPSFTLHHFHGNDKYCPAGLITYRFCKVVFGYRYPCYNSQSSGVSAAAGSTCSVIK